LAERHESFEDALRQHPFLTGYHDELAARLSGLSGGEAFERWCHDLAEWESTAPVHLPLRLVREAAGLGLPEVFWLMMAGLPDEDASFGELFESLQGISGQRRPTFSLLRRYGHADPALDLSAVGPAAAPGASESAILGRIAAAPDAELRTQALIQARLMQADRHRSETQLTHTAVLRSHQIRGWTGGLRATLAGTIAQSTAWVRGYLLAAVSATQAAVRGVSQGLRNALTGALRLAQSLGQQLRTRMSDLATGALSSSCCPWAG
jgi:hypothetical protein